MIDLQHNRVWDWLKRNFFSSPFNIILTFVLMFVAAKLLWNFFRLGGVACHVDRRCRDLPPG